MFVLSSLTLVGVGVAAGFSWKEDFNYQTLSDMQNAGWVVDNPSGTRLESGGVVLDGTGADTVIRYYNHFPTGIYDWSIETRSMWTGVGHSGPGLGIFTEKHQYSMVADGWYSHYAFARDGKTVTFGSYEEQKNAWVTTTMTKQGNTIKLYCNGELIYTYTEQDTSSSQVTGVDRIAPWHGVMLYDYYSLSAADASSEPTTSGGFPVAYAVGGGVTAVAVIGALLLYHFGVIGGGAGTAATGTVATGATGGGASAAAGAGSIESAGALAQTISEKVTALGTQHENLGSQMQKEQDILKTIQELQAKITQAGENPQTDQLRAEMQSEMNRLQQIHNDTSQDLQTMIEEQQKLTQDSQDYLRGGSSGTGTVAPPTGSVKTDYMDSNKVAIIRYITVTTSDWIYNPRGAVSPPTGTAKADYMDTNHKAIIRYITVTTDNLAFNTRALLDEQAMMSQFGEKLAQVQGQTLNSTDQAGALQDLGRSLSDLISKSRTVNADFQTYVADPAKSASNMLKLIQ